MSEVEQRVYLEDLIGNEQMYDSFWLQSNAAC